jgi:hypothetical protein
MATTPAGRRRSESSKRRESNTANTGGRPGKSHGAAGRAAKSNGAAGADAKSNGAAGAAAEADGAAGGARDPVAGRSARSPISAHDPTAVGQAQLDDLLAALRAVRSGDFSARLNTRRGGLLAEIATEFNELAATNQRMSNELVRVGRIIGRDGRMTERATLAGANGAWATSIDSVNSLIDDLVRPTTEVARVIVAGAEGDQ